jgi:putative ATP-dependent endonuclease of OLD family
MKLIQLKLKNFRCYRDQTILDIDDLTCLIGKNDHGKSTVLEALDTFFNDKFDRGDYSVDADGPVEITCTFSDLPDTVILDTSLETSLRDECLLNFDGNLEIMRVYTVAAKSVSKSVFLICEHPQEPVLADLLSQKNARLKAIAEENNVDLTGVTKSKNPLLRKAIREHIGGNKVLTSLKVEGSLNSENNLKDVWKVINSYLPVFTLFRVDKNISDKDQDVQDPMKVAIRESLAIKDIKEKLEEIQEAVRAASTAVAESTIEKLKDIDPQLAEKLMADFNKEPKWDGIFDLTLLNDQGIPLNKRGSGVKRLVLLSFFQAQAEKKKMEDGAPSIIYAIEEPETAQHPNHQKILIRSLIELSHRDNVQVLFTTHSANLVNELPIQSLYFVTREVGATMIEKGYDSDAGIINNTTLDRIIETLGILPNPKDLVEVLIFLEGVHDITALSHYSKIFFEFNNSYIDLNNNVKVAFVLTGGSTLKYYVENKYLDKLPHPQVHIYDNDVDDYIAAVAKLNAEGKKAFNTRKLMMENYLHHLAIEEAYAEDNCVIIVPPITDDMDVPREIAKIVHNANSTKDWDVLEDDVRKKKVSKAKRMLNDRAVKKMTIERIQERNGFDDISDWLKAIKN